MSNSFLRTEAKRVKMTDTESDRVIDSVKEYYGKVLQSRGDLKTEACISPGKTFSKHIKDAMALVHVDVESKLVFVLFYLVWFCFVSTETQKNNSIRSLKYLNTGCNVAMFSLVNLSFNFESEG